MIAERAPRRGRPRHPLGPNGERVNGVKITSLNSRAMTLTAMTPQHFVRNPRSTPQITTRDREMLRSIERLGIVRADHLHDLHVAPGALRVTQRRLRALFDLGLVERTALPIERTPNVFGRSAPLYTITRHGMRLLSTSPSGEVGTIPKARAHLTLSHTLVATDLMISCARSLASSKPSAARAVLVPESVLASRLARYRRQRRVTRLVLPDAAVSLTSPDLSMEIVFEVVASDVRGGNAQFIAKLARYAALHHSGELASSLGLPRIRLVVVVAASSARTRSLCDAAQRLVHGRRLFRFGFFDSDAATKLARAITAEHFDARRWLTLDAEEPTALLTL